MTLANLPGPTYTGADLSQRVNAVLTELRPTRRFASVAELLADTSLTYHTGSRPVAEGLRIEAGGFAYQVAAPSATNHHLATAGGVRLLVLPGTQGHDLRALGAVYDGVTNNWGFLCRALDLWDNVFVGGGQPGLTRCWLGNNDPAGTGQNYNIAAGRTKRIQGDGSVTFVCDRLRSFATPVFLTTTATADLPQGSTSIAVAATPTGVEKGDLIAIIGASGHILETSWSYTVQCVRRCGGTSGSSLLLDQPTDLPFTQAQIASVLVFKPASIRIDAVHLEAGPGSSDPGPSFSAVRFFRLVDSAWTNATMSGQVNGWLDGFSDVLNIDRCDNTLLQNITFRKGRYLPNITGAARYTKVFNCRAEYVRHLDVNTWAQDTHFRDVIGFETDSIIQTHGGIRTVFENVHDHVTQTGIYGFTVRGVGERVVNCSSTSTSGVGRDAQNMTWNTAGRAWARQFPREIRNFRSSTAILYGPNCSRFVVEDCDVPGIIVDSSSGTLAVEIGPRNRVWSQASGHNIMNHDSTIRHRQVQPLLDAVVDDSYVVNTPPRTVTGITRANPGVVTATAHGFANGQQVTFASVGGMTQVNGVTYVVANATANTFELRTPAGAVVDTTGFTAYTSGGTASRASVAITGISQANPGVVTAPSHGLSTGEFVRITNASGMTQVNEVVCLVGAVTTDTFALQTVAGAALDTTGFGAYASGGFATPHKAAKRANLLLSPWIGRVPARHFRMPRLGSATTYTLMLPTENGTVITSNNGRRVGFITVRARSATTLNFTEQVFSYTFSGYLGSAPTVTAQAGLSVSSGFSASISNATPHFNAQLLAEGYVGTTSPTQPMLNRPNDCYWWFDLTFTAAPWDVEVEFREYISV